jgi:nucleoside-diphosphate-sugar epimerase
MTDRVILLTGVTGFLGKVVLEELLRRREELRISRIYAVIRPRGSVTAERRFQREVVQSPCLARQMVLPLRPLLSQLKMRVVYGTIHVPTVVPGAPEVQVPVRHAAALWRITLLITSRSL